MKIIQPNKLFVFLLGFNSIILQLGLFREFYSIFSGNEITFGLSLSFWFLLTAAGAGLGKYFFKKLLLKFFSYLLSFPILFASVLVLLFFNFKNQWFPAGIMLGPFEIAIIILLILFPVCLLFGMAFTLFTANLGNERNSVANFYALETIGSLAGSVVFSFVLIYFLDVYRIFAVVALVNALAIIILMIRAKKTELSLMINLVFLILYSVFILVSNIPELALKKMFMGSQIKEIVENQYGKLVVTEDKGQYSLYENSVLVNVSSNEMNNEESVHYIMIQRPEAKRVLLVSGNLYHSEKELKKYGFIEQIDFVAINEDIYRMEKKYFSEDKHTNAKIYLTDPRKFIRNTNNTYDVVILNTSEPVFSSSNRFYTVEFFRELKNRLIKNAVAGLNLPGVENYMNRQTIELYSSVYFTLKRVFKNVIIIPGNRLFMIFSDGELYMDIASRIEKYKVENLYVNEFYLQDITIKEKSDKILQKLDNDVPINSDLKPVTYYFGLKHWLSYFKINITWLVILVLGCLFVFLIFFKPVNISLLSAGFTSASVEMVIIIAFQAMYGYIYSQLGIIFSLFMAGLFVGSFFISKIMSCKAKNLFWIQIFLVIFLGLIYFVFRSNYSIAHWIFYGIIIIQSVLTGIQFGLSTRLKTQPILINAGNSYGIELLGSAAGAVIISTFIVPLLGIPVTILALMIFNVLVLLNFVVNYRFIKRFA